MDWLSIVGGALLSAASASAPIVVTALIGVGLKVAQGAVAAMQAKGYQTTYIEALTGAVGAAQAAATAAGMTLADPDGRKLGVAAGSQYMASTVSGVAAKLGITTLADHSVRVDSRIGAILAAAQATAAATAAVAPTPASIQISNTLADVAKQATSEGGVSLDTIAADIKAIVATLGAGSVAAQPATAA